MTDLAYVVRFPGSAEEAAAALGPSLARRGFGILATIRVDAVLREKIHEEIDPLLILEVCSPRHAHRALTAASDVALLLPCKIVVRRRAGATEIALLRPEATIGVLLDRPALRPIAQEVEAALSAVLDEVAGSAAP